MTIIWCMVSEIRSVWWTEFFIILDCFLPFYHPPNNPKNQNFEKMKKTLGHIFILQTCTTNDNHMMYGSWDIEHDGQNFLPFWTIFCPFIPLTTQKIKILKKWKKAWRYYHFTQVYIVRTHPLGDGGLSHFSEHSFDLGQIGILGGNWLFRWGWFF